MRTAPGKGVWTPVFCTVALIAALQASHRAAAAAGDACRLDIRRGTADAGDVYVLENGVLRVAVNPLKGGGIEEIRLQTAEASLALPPAQARASRSFDDRIYRQIREDGKTVVELENGFHTYPYTADVLSQTADKVSLKLSCRGRSRAFQWLTVSKTYTLERGVAALVVEHELSNGADTPQRAGIWIPTFIRATGVFSEPNTFFAPTPDGVRSITHPGKDAKGQGDWVVAPPASWKAVLGTSSRCGMVAVLEHAHVAAFYDWYRTSGFISTFEWMVREQEVRPGTPFRTQCRLLPVSDFRCIDAVVAETIACGFVLPWELPAAGQSVAVELALAAPTPQTFSAALFMMVDGGQGAKAIPLLSAPVELTPGATQTLDGVLVSPGPTPCRVTLELRRDGQLLGATTKVYQPGTGWSAPTVTPSASPRVGAEFVYPVLHQKLDGYQNIELRIAQDVTAAGQQAGPESGKAEALDATETHRLQALKNYPGLDAAEDISADVVTPHIPWMKPSALGRLEALYLCYLATPGVVDTRKRNVLECAQRMELDFTFIPLLKRIAAYQSRWSQTPADDLEPYIIDRVREEIQRARGVIVVDGLDFRGVQPELADLLLDAAAAGRGVVIAGCRTLPDSFEQAVAAGRCELPASFYCIPELNRKLPVERLLPRLCRTALHGTGRIAIVSTQKKSYPCVPLERISERCPNYYGREIPYWEYMLLPMLKAMAWASGAHGPVMSNVQCVDGRFTATVTGAVTPLELRLRFRDEYGRAECTERHRMAPATGPMEVTVTLPQLPGGLHLAEYQLVTSSGAVHDFGCCALEAPSDCSVDAIAFDANGYRAGAEITVRVSFSDVPAECRLTADVEDMSDRHVLRLEQPLHSGQTDAELQFTVAQPYSVLHRLFVSIRCAERTLAGKMAEFSMPFSQLPMDDLIAYQWYSQPLGLKRWQDFGFDCLVTSFRKAHILGSCKALSNMNIRPYSMGIGSVAGSPAHKKDHHYYGLDLIREPCFSDPDLWQRTRQGILEYAEQDLRHGIHDYHLVDELHMGPAVCFSEHCLKAFREYLKTTYSSLGALNQEWHTSFRDWDAVKPLSVMEVDPRMGNMMSWLDHRMFMNLVFARWVGGIKAILQEVNPNVKAGLSGTTGPGTTYDWWELMKTVDCLGNYGGIQNDLIRSFQTGGARTGKWTGGYVPIWLDGEKYERTAPWFGVLNDNRGYFFWHGSTKGYTLLGDLRPSHNLRYVIEELSELKSGVAKLLFTSERASDGIAMHYSQASMFAATATVGKEFWDAALDSWKYLLEDLGLTFHFVSYEQLARDGLDLSKTKVCILPLSLCLSAAEAAQLRRFVQAGGVLVADHAPGVYDEHGKRVPHTDLLELFGIERTDSEIRTATCRLQVRERRDAGVRARSGLMRYGEDGIRLTTAVACADTGNPKAPALTVNRFGQGRAILLNLVVGDYARVALGGEGGETATIGRGNPDITTPIRELVEDVLAGSGIRRQVRLTTASGDDYQPLTTVVRYRDGNAHYVGILRNDSSVEPIEPSDYVPVDIAFGRKGAVYDVRAKEYLGQRDSVRTAMAPAKAKLYAIMPYRIKRVKLSTEAQYAPGQTVSVGIAVSAGRRQAGGHVVRFVVLGPDGADCRDYAQNLRLQDGKGTARFVTALNDPTGRWRIVATDVVSGLSGETSFDLE